jgi:hypothetical protein
MMKIKQPAPALFSVKQAGILFRGNFLRSWKNAVFIDPG